jgi:hypothetical protein
MPTVNNGGLFFRGLVLQRLRRFRIEPRRGNTAGASAPAVFFGARPDVSRRYP